MRKLTLVAVAAVLVACSHDTLKPVETAADARDKNTTTTVSTMPVQKTEAKDDSERVAQAVTRLLGLDAEIVRTCNLHFEVAPSEEGAPRFDTDESDLTAQDTSILSQVATCLTNGPLAGRHVRLVGRADSRGTSEYNFALGEHRASKVSDFLEKQGVQSVRINATSRGELDATGTDETSMRDDRRVDILLGS